MIKRDGVEIMNARTKNVSIAKETLEILKQKHYTSPSGQTVDISASLDSAINGTVYYPADEKVAVKSIYRIPTFEVTNETTAQAAARLLGLGKDNLVALNFASARNQGGGFLAGAVAQEEDLCRSSGLYACLKRKPLFYNANILFDTHYYTDGIIYSPDVPFFRDEHLLFLEQPFNLSIVSAPAPNLRGIENPDELVTYQFLVHRARKILQVAAANGNKNIILGAWGCGAFGNSPEMVAEVFMSMLKDVPAFEHVCFAVHDTSPEQLKYETFKQAVLQK